MHYKTDSSIGEVKLFSEWKPFDKFDAHKYHRRLPSLKTSAVPLRETEQNGLIIVTAEYLCGTKPSLEMGDLMSHHPLLSNYEKTQFMTKNQIWPNQFVGRTKLLYNVFVSHLTEIYTR